MESESGTGRDWRLHRLAVNDDVQVAAPGASRPGRDGLPVDPAKRRA
jgi:hypothetical protein